MRAYLFMRSKAAAATAAVATAKKLEKQIGRCEYELSRHTICFDNDLLWRKSIYFAIVCAK